jgi:glucose/arabinose dehydrogenase
MQRRTIGCFAAAAFLALAAHAQTSQSPNTSGSSASAAKSSANDWLPAESHFRKVVLDQDETIDGKLQDTLKDPMEMSVAKDGRIIFVERAGVVKLWSPATGKSKVIATLPTFTGLEDGLLGVTLDPKFTENGWVYVNRSLPETTTNEFGKAGIIRVSRFPHPARTVLSRRGLSHIRSGWKPLCLCRRQHQPLRFRWILAT